MRDEALETQLRLLVLQIEAWKKLHDLIIFALDKSKPAISADQERQFTELRGILLQETEHVLTELNLVAELSGKAMSVLQRAASLRRVREFTGEEGRRLESDWNGVFTKLGVVQGQLKSRRRELLGRTPLQHALIQLFGRKQAAR